MKWGCQRGAGYQSGAGDIWGHQRGAGLWGTLELSRVSSERGTFWDVRVENGASESSRRYYGASIDVRVKQGIWGHQRGAEVAGDIRVSRVPSGAGDIWGRQSGAGASGDVGGEWGVTVE